MKYVPPGQAGSIVSVQPRYENFIGGTPRGTPRIWFSMSRTVSRRDSLSAPGSGGGSPPGPRH